MQYECDNVNIMKSDIFTKEERPYHDAPQILVGSLIIRIITYMYVIR
jgi:hypothetical protein